MASFSTEEFMEEIHKYECLYNRYCKEYKDKFKKLNAWKAVSDKFGLEPSTAEAKFKNVRTAYGRWLKKRKNTPSGSGRDAIQMPVEFANLDWLQTHIESRQTTTNVGTTQSLESSPLTSCRSSTPVDLEEVEVITQNESNEIVLDEDEECHDRDESILKTPTTQNISKTEMQSSSANKNAKHWGKQKKVKGVSSEDVDRAIFSNSKLP